MASPEVAPQVIPGFARAAEVKAFYIEGFTAALLPLNTVRPFRQSGVHVNFHTGAWEHHQKLLAVVGKWQTNDDYIEKGGNMIT